MCSITLNLHHICSETENNAVNSVFPRKTEHLSGYIFSEFTRPLFPGSVMRAYAGHIQASLFFKPTFLFIYLFLIPVGVLA